LLDGPKGEGCRKSSPQGLGRNPYYEALIGLKTNLGEKGCKTRSLSQKIYGGGNRGLRAETVMGFSAGMGFFNSLSG